MERGKLAVIMLTIVNAVLMVVCAVLYLMEDRHEPEFSFTASELVYREGIEESALLEGVSAYDSVDGDVTDRIVIEKTMENWDDNTVAVFYAVNDRAGNVAKASRVFDAIYIEKDTESMLVSSIMESGFNVKPDREHFIEDDNTDGASDKAEDASGEEAEDEDEIEETSDEEAEDEESEDEEAEDEEVEDEEAEDEEAEDEEPAAPPAPRPNPSAPILILRESEISVNVGQKPPWVDIIETMRDDKDDYATLFYNLNVSEYDRNKPGTYQVTLYVEDSDGNKSENVPVTIIVKDNGT